MTVIIRRTKHKKKEPVTTTAAEFKEAIKAYFVQDILAEYDEEPFLFYATEKTRKTKREKPAFNFSLIWADLETGEEVFSATEAIEVQLFDDDFNARRLGTAWAHAINLKLGLIEAKRYSLHRADEDQFID